MVYFLKKSTPSKKGLYLQIYINYYDSSTKKKKTISYKALGYVSDLQAKFKIRFLIIKKKLVN